ncbi:MAG: ABC transporter permease [Henriciella sp.]|nr:ABC transporter permease [Henriciella sp.]
MKHIFKMAFRNLGRNRRRSALSAIAVALGTAMLLFMAAMIRGEFRDSINLTILLQTGHLQVHTAGYESDNLSLVWEDLIENPLELSRKIGSIPQVMAATPRLYISGIIAFKNETLGAQIIGIDPISAANAPFRGGLVDGEFLRSDDREGILIGLPLADKLDVHSGDSLELLVNTSDGNVDQQRFIIRGIYSTNTPGYDKTTIFMPLAKAQTITRTENHASQIFILLDDIEHTQAVKDAIQTSQYVLEDWEEMNKLIVIINRFSTAYMLFLNLIVLGVTSTVILNTLLMAVYERTREMGILQALGMKGRQLMSIFLAEAGFLAIGGVALGLVIGLPLVFYFARFGIHFGDLGQSNEFLIGSTIYLYPTWGDTISLSLSALFITVLSALYPAWQASKLEPVEALRSDA